MAKADFDGKNWRKSIVQVISRLTNNAIAKEIRDEQDGRNPVNGPKRQVQEIFLREGMPGVIGFIESHKDADGNYLYPGKIVDGWLQELAPEQEGEDR